MFSSLRSIEPPTWLPNRSVRPLKTRNWKRNLSFVATILAALSIAHLSAGTALADPIPESTPAPEISFVQFGPSETPEVLSSEPSIEYEQPAAASGVALPWRILIPAIGVDAAVESVGLTPEGAMDVPKDPDQVAWYELGPKPGETGNAILAGHVDWAGRTRAFWGLRQLQYGDVITVLTSDYTQYDFVVTDQRSYEAATAPVEEVFRQNGSTEITLITCGGDFDYSTRQYLSRTVVRAVLQ